MSGHVSCLFTADPRVANDGGVEFASQGIRWVGSSGPGRKRIRLNRKSSCTPRSASYSISATGVEEIASCGTCFPC